MVEQLLVSLEKVFTTSPGWGLGASFLAGILVSFSPCIYPLIPITLGVVGVESASTRLRSFSISLVFVLGFAVVFTVLGVVSSLIGKFLGTFFVNPITYLILTIILFSLGLSSLTGFTINIPFFSFNYDSNKPKEYFSIFILGMVSAFGIIPCSFPVLGAILSVISLQQNIVYGAVALFIFSLGYGTLLIVLGTFSGLIKKLPKQGKWLTIIKRIPGVLLMVMAVYFLVKFISLI
ncbi:MAG: sulfite exporter TauE/SafE family protein [Candidatus Omnitrophica bacterium]|nr:sulfite exporter TauE/SafE family protein [Candidatus Omnitrophota bacterium]